MPGAISYAPTTASEHAESGATSVELSIAVCAAVHAATARRAVASALSTALRITRDKIVTVSTTEFIPCVNGTALIAAEHDDGWLLKVIIDGPHGVDDGAFTARVTDALTAPGALGVIALLLRELPAHVRGGDASAVRLVAPPVARARAVLAAGDFSENDSSSAGSDAVTLAVRIVVALGVALCCCVASVVITVVGIVVALPFLRQRSEERNWKIAANAAKVETGCLDALGTENDASEIAMMRLHTNEHRAALTLKAAATHGGEHLQQQASSTQIAGRGPSPPFAASRCGNSEATRAADEAVAIIARERTASSRRLSVDADCERGEFAQRGDEAASHGALIDAVLSAEQNAEQRSDGVLASTGSIGSAGASEIGATLERPLWVRFASHAHGGASYFVHDETAETVWELPHSTAFRDGELEIEHGHEGEVLYYDAADAVSEHDDDDGKFGVLRTSDDAEIAIVARRRESVTSFFAALDTMSSTAPLSLGSREVFPVQV